VTGPRVRLSMAAFLAAFLSAAPFVAPGLVGGDAGELAAAAWGLGIGHPTGYPLWTLLANLFGALPLGTYAFRLALLSWVSWALAIALLGDALSRRGEEGEESAPLGYGLAFFIGWSPLVLAQGIVPEVYGLHFLLSVGLLWTMRVGGRAAFPLSCLLLGAGLAHHHTLVFLTPAWGWHYRERLRRPVEALRGLSLALLSSSLLLYLPLRSMRQPWPADWGHPRTFADFWSHLMRHQYGGDLDGRWDMGLPYLREFLWNLLVEGWGILLILAIVGTLLLWKRRESLFSWLLAWVGVTLAFPMFVHTPPNVRNLQVNEAFFPPVMVWTAPLGMAALVLLWREAGRLGRRKTLATAFVLVLFARFLSVAWHHRPLTHPPVERMTRNLLLTLPRGSVFYGGEDLTTFSLAYAQGPLGLRRDVKVFDRAGGLFENLYHVLDDDPPRMLSDAHRVRLEREWEASHGSPLALYATEAVAPGRVLVRRGLFYVTPTPRLDPGDSARLWSRYRVPVGSTLDAPLDREAAALFHITRAWASLEEGEEETNVLRSIQEADRLARDDAGTLTNIAILLERLGREAASRETVFRALQADSAFPEAWNLLGALDLSRGRWDQALEAFGRCLETRRWDPIALDGRALALEGSGRMEEALRVWRELIAAQSSYAPAYRNLGLALARGDREESARLLSEYLRRSPSAPDRKAIERTLRGKVGPSSPFKGSER